TAPGNGWDVFFGYGRVNVWKALLAVANGGIATDRTDEFPSLSGRVKNDAATTWYGFKMHSPVHEATIWLGNMRLTDTGFGAGPVPLNLTAYAGVPTNPVRSIVPLGNGAGGEYVATFSVTRADLVQGGTLRLRRPGEGAGVAAFYTLDLSNLGNLRNG